MRKAVASPSYLLQNCRPSTSPAGGGTPGPNSFNGVISSSSKQGAYHEALIAFFSMRASAIHPDAHTFPALLKSCASLSLLNPGLSLHQTAIVTGFACDSYVASSLINFYSRFGYPTCARKVFDVMTERNVFVWTALINCYSGLGNFDAAVSMCNSMRRRGVDPTPITVLAMLPGVSELTHVRMLHACSIHHGFEWCVPLLNSLLNMYCRFGENKDAKSLFESMGCRQDIVTWDFLISGYAKTGRVKEILELLRRMRNEGMEPDQRIFGSLASAAALQSNLKVGKMVHAQILTAGLMLNALDKKPLLVIYLECGCIEDAILVFQQDPAKDEVMWTTMIQGLVKSDLAGKALCFFHWMITSGKLPSAANMVSALVACAQLGCFYQGASIHGYMLRHGMTMDVSVHNSLVNMYAKCNHLGQSCAVFEMACPKSVVSWNAIITGHAQSGHLFGALCFYDNMRRSLERPNNITMMTLIQACASAGALHPGKCLHTVMVRSGVVPCVLVDTALVDMYCKCGAVGTAEKYFERMPRQDLVSWGAMIDGYGSHGKGHAALKLYSSFLQTGIKPNSVIFLSVLSACSHNGLVSEGLSLFWSMKHDFGIEPKLKHHACVVDLLARAGRVQEAYEFVKRMTLTPTLEILGILLDACRATRNAGLGEIVAQKICGLRPVNPDNIVQLANGYASMRRWEGVGRAWSHMKSLGLRKLPGWSFVEVQGTLVTFFMGHSSHPQHAEITAVLKLLGDEISRAAHSTRCPLLGSNPFKER